MPCLYNSRNHLKYEKKYLIGVPVPSRDESMTEYALAKEWRKIFAEKLSDLYQDWLHRNKTPEDALKILRIPYIPFWSFGKRLPVVEEGVEDPKSLGFSYEFLARLIANRLEWEKAFKQKESPMVFISHAKEDAKMARKLNDDLERRGISTWFDEKDILPGQNWKIVIRQAIKKSDFLIILLSEHSVRKRGFVQAEQKLAFDVMDEMPESDVFVIPIRIR